MKVWLLTMNEKGFATILGLCLILAIALVVKGIQESEGNHAYETTDFQTELDLQNAAEVGIYKAVKMVCDNPNLLPGTKDYPPSRTNAKHKIIDKMEIKTLNNSTVYVDVWGEQVVIKRYEVDYKPNPDVANLKIISVTGDEELFSDGAKAYEVGYSFFSTAELNSTRTGGKVYRRAFAYVVDEVIIERIGDVQKIREDIIGAEEKNVVHFMEVSAGGYTYKE